MNKKTYIALSWVKYSFMVLIILLCAYIVFFETNNFCVEIRSANIELGDLGVKCFRSLTEVNEYKQSVRDKYEVPIKPVSDLIFYINETPLSSNFSE